MRFYL
jgi:hypothetical protein